MFVLLSSRILAIIEHSLQVTGLAVERASFSRSQTEGLQYGLDSLTIGYVYMSDDVKFAFVQCHE